HHPEIGELSLDLSKAMISRGLERAVDDQARYCSNVPWGISKEEAKAAAFDENCPFCVAKAEAADRAAAAPPDGHGAEEDCPLCDDMVRAWRAQNAEALAKRGVKCRPTRKTPRKGLRPDWRCISCRPESVHWSGIRRSGVSSAVDTREGSRGHSGR
ncbi:MAG: hypothetical protein H0T89_35365, partial [Deltaproteobacteria bacterium]|nr:hypothetical protein [Deltaproteobacteria bacterium]